MHLNEVGRRPRPIETAPKKTEEEIKKLKERKLEERKVKGGNIKGSPIEKEFDYKNLNSTTDIKKYLEENSED